MWLSRVERKDRRTSGKGRGMQRRRGVRGWNLPRQLQPWKEVAAVWAADPLERMVGGGASR